MAVKAYKMEASTKDAHESSSYTMSEYFSRIEGRCYT